MSNAVINLITKNTTKEQMTDAYRKYPDTSPDGFQEFNASTVEPIVCEIPAGVSVLDVGCNSGELMKILKEQKKCRVVGVDISETALKIAKSKGLRVLNASAEELPFKDNRFDVVILREVLTHVHEPLKALKEIRRVLKPNGFVLGSVPHANLERIVWDDARLHHRYYDEEKLKSDLSESFETTHLKVLTGKQFMFNFSQSLLADMPAEMLFKSGRKDTPNWEDALLKDTKTLRVWMGPTQPPGDAYYRMIGYAEKMKQMGCEIGYDRFSFNSDDSCSEWQRKILPSENFMPSSSIAVSELDKCLKVANPWVFQITYYDDILEFFRCAKEVYKGKKLITECDDWLFDIPSCNIASNPYKPGSEKEQIAFDQLELSDAIIVSTNFIKENFEQMFPGKPIYVIPNSIDFDIWDNAKSDGKCEPKKDGVVRIGFSGCGNHNGDLEIVKPVLLALLDEYPNLEVIMSGHFECFKDVKHPRFLVPGRWVNILEYPAMIKGWDLDIGIAPLRDNNFNRAKSNLRWLEYSALGIPTVASNVRPFADSIKEEVGFLCSEKQAWYKNLKNLIDHPDLRKYVGGNAYKEVKDKFNMAKVAEEYRAILERIKTS